MALKDFVTVEIAWDHGPLEPHPTWTDITEYVSAISGGGGRGGEFDTFGARSYTITVTDLGRIFDPSNDGSPYDGKIVPRKQLRIRTAGDMAEPAVLFSDDFAGSNGASWNSGKWSTATDGGTGASLQIQGNRGRLTSGTSVYGSTYAVADEELPQEYEVLLTDVRFSNVSSEQYFRMYFRGDASQTNEIAHNSIGLIIEPDNDSIHWYDNGGGGSSTWVKYEGFNFSASTDYMIRVRVEESSVKIKIWESGDPEPDAWLSTLTSSEWLNTHEGEYFAMSFVGGNDTTSEYVEIGDISIKSLVGEIDGEVIFRGVIESFPQDYEVGTKKVTVPIEAVDLLSYLETEFLIGDTAHEVLARSMGAFALWKLDDEKRVIDAIGNVSPGRYTGIKPVIGDPLEYGGAGSFDNSGEEFTVANVPRAMFDFQLAAAGIDDYDWSVSLLFKAKANTVEVATYPLFGGTTQTFQTGFTTWPAIGLYSSITSGAQHASHAVYGNGSGLATEASPSVLANVTGSRIITDNLPHHLVMVSISYEEVYGYCDGEQDAHISSLNSNGYLRYRGSRIQPHLGHIIDEVALFPRSLAQSEVRLLARAALGGLFAQRTDERLATLMQAAGIPESLYSFEMGSAVVASMGSGDSLLSMCQSVQMTENGRFFVSREGIITFHAKTHSAYATSEATFSDIEGNGFGYEGFGFDYDVRLLSTRAAVSAIAGTAVASATSGVLESVGTRSINISTELIEVDEARSYAEHIVGLYQDPLLRARSWTVDLTVLSEEDRKTLCSLDIGSHVTLERTPLFDNDTIVQEMVIESIEHEISNEPLSWKVTFTAVPDVEPTYFRWGRSELGGTDGAGY